MSDCSSYLSFKEVPKILLKNLQLKTWQSKIWTVFQKPVLSSTFTKRNGPTLAAVPPGLLFHHYYLSGPKCSGTKPHKKHYIHTEHGDVFFPLKWPMSGFILLSGMTNGAISQFSLHTHKRSRCVSTTSVWETWQEEALLSGSCIMIHWLWIKRVHWAVQGVSQQERCF